MAPRPLLLQLVPSLLLLATATTTTQQPEQQPEPQPAPAALLLLRSVQARRGRDGDGAVTTDWAPLGERLFEAAPPGSRLRRPAAAQRYEPLAPSGGPRRRRRGQADGQAHTAAPPTTQLTVETTAQMRIHADYSQLYPGTATPYSVCFSVGDWFRWNFASLPPGSGDVCDRVSSRAIGRCV